MPAYLLPNHYQPPNQSYSDLRTLALDAVFHGEYSLGFAYLRRAFLDTEFFSRTDVGDKKRALRSFARIICASAMSRAKRTIGAVDEECRKVVEMEREKRLKLRGLKKALSIEIRADKRLNDTTRCAVEEMSEIVLGVCRNPAPEFSSGLFATLEELFCARD